VEALLCLARPGKDWLALGGFCIIGMQPTLKPLFAEVVRRVAPLVKRKGLRRVHVLGVFADDALSYAAGVLGREGLEFSTDTSSVELNSIMGKRWDVEDRSERGSPWRKVYSKADKFKKYHPADLAMENTTRASAWCRSLPGGGDTSAAIPSRPSRPLDPYQTTLW
jgi:hypothetical protein